MPDRVQDLTNHRKVAVACKNYTDQKAEEILWQLAENDVSTSDDNTTASTKTVPANATRCKIKRIYGNSVKYAPSTASDDSVARIKSIPENTYKSQIDYIGGKTVKYNQLVKEINSTNWTANNATATYTDGVATFTATAQNGNINQYLTSYLDNHKYLAIAQVKLTTANTNIRLYGNGGYLSVYSTATTDWQVLSKIFTGSSSEDRAFNIRDTRSSDWDAVQVKNAMLIDLTYIFGAGNEPSTVETAIPLLKANGYKLDGTDEYSTGSLKHAVVSGVEYLPINLWDEQWELGYWNTSTGQAGTTTAEIRSKNPINVLPNTTYYFKTPYNMNVLFYDSNNIFISPLGVAKNTTFTTPANARYMRFNFGSSYGTTYNHDICINISNASYNGNYYPYVAPIPKQIPAEIQANEYYGLGYDENSYNKLDLITRNIVADWKYQLLNGTENWQYDSTSGKEWFYLAVGAIILQNSVNIKSSKLTEMSRVSITNSDDNFICANSNILIRMTQFNGDIPSFKTWLASNNIEVIFRMANTQTIDVSQYIDDSFKSFTTNNQYATCEMVCDEPIDMPNKVEYFGTIKEALCTAINKNDVLAVSLTNNDAKYGWSVNTIYNTRDYTTNKGSQKVGKYTFTGNENWNYNSTAQRWQMNVTTSLLPPTSSTLNVITDANVQVNLVTNTYQRTGWEVFGDSTKLYVYINDSTNLPSNVNPNTIFMAGKVLYYELALEEEEDITPINNVIEVVEDDELEFVNSENQAVPSDITYRIEVAQ